MKFLSKDFRAGYFCIDRRGKPLYEVYMTTSALVIQSEDLSVAADGGSVIVYRPYPPTSCADFALT